MDTTIDPGNAKGTLPGVPLDHHDPDQSSAPSIGRKPWDLIEEWERAKRAPIEAARARLKEVLARWYAHADSARDDDYHTLHAVLHG